MSTMIIVDHSGTADQGAEEAIRQGLAAHDRALVGDRSPGRMMIALRDPAGAVVGGVLGETAWGWCMITAIWVAEPQRGQGHGRRLLQAAEDVAVRRGCRRATMDVFSFQALAFFTRHGYQIYGQLDGLPEGQTRYSLRKDLGGDASAVAPDIAQLIAIAPDAAAQPTHYLELLHQITLDLLNRRDLDELLQVIVDRAADILDAPYGEIMLSEGDELVVRAFTRNQPYLLGDRVRRGEALVTWRAFDTQQPVLIEDYTAWSGRRVVYDGAELRAVADFPILMGSICLGVIAMARTAPNHPFGAEEVQRGMQFSHLVALVLDNERTRHTQEALIAARTAALSEALRAVEEREARLTESLRDLQSSHELIRELSAPVLPVLPGVLVVPFVGELRLSHASALQQRLLMAISRQRATMIILDITGLPVVDDAAARTLLDVARAAQLLGARPVLVGVRPEVAETLTAAGTDMRALTIFRTLQDAVHALIREQARGAQGAR